MYREEIWSCSEKIKRQPEIIIGTNFVAVTIPMLHTKAWSQRFFLILKKDFNCLFWLHLGLWLFKQNANLPLTKITIWNLVKPGQVNSKEKAFKFLHYIYVYSSGAEEDNAWGLQLWLVLSFATFIIYCKCQQELFKMFWENAFQHFPHIDTTNFRIC